MFISKKIISFHCTAYWKLQYLTKTYKAIHKLDRKKNLVCCYITIPIPHTGMREPVLETFRSSHARCFKFYTVGGVKVFRKESSSVPLHCIYKIC